MDVGPARQPHSPLAFPSGGWATFPTLGTVPHNGQARTSTAKKPLYISRFLLQVLSVS